MRRRAADHEHWIVWHRGERHTLCDVQIACEIYNQAPPPRAIYAEKSGGWCPMDELHNRLGEPPKL